MNKKCIFCGEHPISKTKEHVLPTWLLEMTGDPNRPLHLPLLRNKFEKPAKPMSFSSLHFPACQRCNRIFSSLEAKTKPIFSKMLNSKGLTNEEISTLLDWLDKVRVGLWLGILLLEKNPFNIAPSFHISKRMAEKDRMVVIYSAKEKWSGITFTGINFPIFHHAPSCFSLIINHLGFFNMSAEFLFSRRLGFPFPEATALHESGVMQSLIKPGRARTMLPLLKYTYSTLGTEIFQPMFPPRMFVHGDPAEISDLYNSNYVESYSLNYKEGIGLPIIQKDKSLIKYPFNESMAWVPSETMSLNDMRDCLTEQTFHCQLKLLEDSPMVSDRRTKQIALLLRKSNKLMLQKIRDLRKQRNQS